MNQDLWTFEVVLGQMTFVPNFKKLYTYENITTTCNNIWNRLRDIWFPFVQVDYSTLWGKERADIHILVSFDDRKDWVNWILENSRYARFSLSQDGILEKFSGRGKFRKTKLKDLDKDLIKKFTLFFNK